MEQNGMRALPVAPYDQRTSDKVYRRSKKCCIVGRKRAQIYTFSVPQCIKFKSAPFSFPQFIIVLISDKPYRLNIFINIIIQHASSSSNVYWSTIFIDGSDGLFGMFGEINDEKKIGTAAVLSQIMKSVSCIAYV